MRLQGALVWFAVGLKTGWSLVKAGRTSPAPVTGGEAVGFALRAEGAGEAPLAEEA